MIGLTASVYPPPLKGGIATTPVSFLDAQVVGSQLMRIFAPHILTRFAVAHRKLMMKGPTATVVRAWFMMLAEMSKMSAVPVDGFDWAMFEPAIQVH